MVFDPEKISLIVAGAKVTGYADGSKVSAEHNKDAVSPTTGIQGDTVYALFQPTRPLRGATAKVYKSLCTFLR